MARSDQIAKQFAQLRTNGATEEQLAAIEAFFRRVSDRLFEFTDIRAKALCRGGSFKLTRYQSDGKPEPPYKVDYDSEGNKFRVNGKLYSDARMAEFMGVPMAYLQGLTECLTNLHVDESRATRIRQKIKQKEEMLDREIAQTKSQHERLLAASCQSIQEAYGKVLVDLKRELAYPPPPPPSLTPTKFGDGLPAGSGVYFIWSVDSVEYVGQSIHLSQRVRLTHDRIMADDMLSFVEVPETDLNFAESYYIGILRPVRNFGWRSKHNRMVAGEAEPFTADVEPRVPPPQNAQGQFLLFEMSADQ